MTPRSRCVALLAATAILASLLAPADTRADSVAEIRKDVDKAYRLLKDALHDGDAEQVAREIYTKDARIIIPERAVIEGRQAIAEHIQYIIDFGHDDFRSRIDELLPAGDMALETGDVTVYDEQGDKAFRFRFMTVWKKEDGKWKIYRDMTNF